MTRSAIAAGSCLCGAIRFEFALPTKWCAHCYCSLCRKAHGAGFVTWVGVEAESFKVTGGNEDLSVYRSSPEAERRFCRRCGASMFFASTKWPGEMHIALAHVDSPIDRVAEKNVLFDNKPQWVDLQSVKGSDRAS